MPVIFLRKPALPRTALLALCAALLCAAPAVPADTDTPVAEPPPLSERIDALIDVLKEHGIDFDPEEGYETVLEALIAVADPLGGLQTEAAEETRARRRAGTLYDAGIRLRITNETVRIDQVMDNTPARDSGLEEGHTLLQIDEADIEKLGLHRILNLLRSDEAAPVTLTVQTNEGIIETQRVDRVETTLDAIESKESLPFQLAYLKVNRLREGTGTIIAEQIKRWTDEDRYGILLDLRGADGEDLDSVQAVAQHFAEPGALLFAYRDSGDQDIHVAHAENGGPLALPVMVLIDGETGGAAEVLATVLSDSVRGAMLFGQETRGDMLVREIVELPDGARLYLATRRLVTADGETHIGMSGVRPDVVTVRDDEDTSAHKPVRSARTEVLDEEIEQEKLYHRVRGDATLRRAVDVLLGLKALDIRPRGNDPRHNR